MDKPIKPSKTVLKSKGATYHFDYVSKQISLLVFLDWLKETIPEKATDVTIGIGEDFYYDDSQVWLAINWKEPTKNTKYKSEMKKYEKQLKKWKKENGRRHNAKR